MTTLADIGIEPVTPNARSSDADDACFDPFGHFLKRRLGLQPAATEAKALREGKWLHAHFQHLDAETDTAYAAAMIREIQKVEADLVDRCQRGGIGQETIRRLCDLERDTLSVTGAWLDAALDVPIKQYGSFREFLDHDRWEVVSREDCLDLRSDTGLWFTVKPDLLLLDNNTHKLYVVDLKSTGEPTEVRAATCPFEFQSWHYVYTIAEMLARGFLDDLYGLPSDVTMGGMYHLIMQRPTISPSKPSDTIYRYVAHGKKLGRQGRAVQQDDGHWKVESWAEDQGPIAAVVERCADEDGAIVTLHKMTGKKPAKEFEDEPSMELYAARCQRWYKAEGEYKHLSIERESPVEISFTDGDLMTDEEIRREYYAALERVIAYATCDPDPRNFMKNYAKIRAWKQLSPYAPFYTNPLEDWPEIIARHHFIIEHRDDPNIFLPNNDSEWMCRPDGEVDTAAPIG
jgi:hypothetical protein